MQNHLGEHLDHTWHDGDRDVVVVVAHGVTSHKDRPWLEAVSNALTAVGIPSVRISFAGNGESEGRYEDSTISKEVLELGAVFDQLTASHPGHKLAYAGHSMGGAVGGLRAARDPRVHAAVSLAGMVRVRRFVETVFDGLTPGQDVLLGKQHCPYSKTYHDDCLAHDDLRDQAALVRCPWLLIHGDADELVPFEDAEIAHRANPEHTEIHRLPGIDHRFAGAEERMAKATAQWLSARCAEE